VIVVLLLLAAASAFERRASGPAAGAARAGKSACTCAAYRPLFAEYGGPLGIPVSFMCALACRESRCNPSSQDGPAWGLMQIVEVVRRSIARQGGAASSRYTRPELLQPRVSVYLAVQTMRNVLRAFAQVGEPAQWKNPRWVGLFVAGWNAGYSLKAGVAGVVRWLKARGLAATVENVHAYGRQAGAVEWIWKHPHRLTWWRSVVDKYRELGGFS